jgi:GNAT superfamily N-acetyltransferase
MNGIFLTSRIEIVEAMKPFLFDNEIENELGEVLKYCSGDKWLVNDIGFGCYNGNKIRYIYVVKQLRNNGIGLSILNSIEREILKSNICIKLVCKPSVLRFYEKQGYSIEKKFVNWLNLKKCKTKI